MDFSVFNLLFDFQYRKESPSRIHIFLLATESDPGFYPDIFRFFREMDSLTSEIIVFHYPRLKFPSYASQLEIIYNQSDMPDNEAMIRAFSRYMDLRHISDIFDKFNDVNTKQTIQIANAIGIPANKLPCLLIASPNENHYVIPLQDEWAGATGLVRLLREISTLLVEKDKEYIRLISSIKQKEQQESKFASKKGWVYAEQMLIEKLSESHRNFTDIDFSEKIAFCNKYRLILNSLADKCENDLKKIKDEKSQLESDKNRVVLEGYKLLTRKFQLDDALDKVEDTVSKGANFWDKIKGIVPST